MSGRGNRRCGRQATDHRSACSHTSRASSAPSRSRWSWETLELADRVAGLLVALYAQPVSRICRISLDDIDTTGQPTTVIVNGARLELDTDTGRLLRQLVDHQSTDGRQAWLFPGRHPRQPVAAKSLTERLNRVGVTCSARVAAFHDLAAQIPSPVLADLIGYNPHFLAERAAALGTPWQRYAAIRSSVVVASASSTPTAAGT